MLNSTDLAYFIEVANTLNLSRASERLGISQPSLSTAIKRVEQQIGAPLLLRHKRGVNLTQAGKQLFAHAKQLTQVWEDIKSKSLASMYEIQGEVTIGCHQSLGLFYLAKVLPILLENHSNIQIKLKHDLSRRITEQVINFTIDVGIVVNPVKHPDLIIKKLRTDDVTFWTSNTVTSKNQDINSPHAVLICDPDLLQAQYLLNRAKKMGMNFKRFIPTNSLELVTHLTDHGAGIGILPTSIATGNFFNPLKRVKKAPVFVDEVCLVYRPENRNVQAIQKVISMIKENQPHHSVSEVD